MRLPYPCPEGYRVYKNICLFVTTDLLKYKDSQTACAKFGGMIMPLRDRGTYQFIRSLAKLKSYRDLFIGMNFSINLENPLYSDGTIFNRSTHYQFDSEAEKFGQKDCVYLKTGVSHKPRSTDCDVPMQSVCQWRSSILCTLKILINCFLEPTCPENFFLFARESDGRTCYGSSEDLDQSVGPARTVKAKCKVSSNHLIRPGLPSSLELLTLIPERLDVKEIYMSL